ncbi:adenylate cyclase type 9-like [Thrips palmi]|uniref:Adenylate cyclase type 9-like n=1 Tax=Thrips palmi TaxID=161013 RepID=A0A6P9ABY4_THRPL|nr:adenylate cyclase type 9-like [Thrips palmi]
MVTELILLFRIIDFNFFPHRISDRHGDSPPTLATSRFNTYFDIFISALVYSAIAMSLFFLYAASPMWIAVFVTATVIQVFAVCLCALLLWTPLGTLSDESPASQCTEEASTGSHLLVICKSLVEKFSGWYPWHVCGAILVSLPATSVLANFSCPSLALGNETLGNAED